MGGGRERTLGFGREEGDGERPDENREEDVDDLARLGYGGAHINIKQNPQKGTYYFPEESRSCRMKRLKN